VFHHFFDKAGMLNTTSFLLIVCSDKNLNFTKFYLVPSTYPKNPQQPHPPPIKKEEEKIQFGGNIFGNCRNWHIWQEFWCFW